MSQKKLDDDDKLFLKAFLSIPANKKLEDWHKECQNLQYKLYGSGDIGYIEDSDWDKAMDFLSKYLESDYVDSNKTDALKAVYDLLFEKYN